VCGTVLNISDEYVLSPNDTHIYIYAYRSEDWCFAGSFAFAVLVNTRVSSFCQSSCAFSRLHSFL
jgi:hypothetical protein